MMACETCSRAGYVVKVGFRENLGRLEVLGLTIYIAEHVALASLMTTRLMARSDSVIVRNGTRDNIGFLFRLDGRNTTNCYGKLEFTTRMHSEDTEGDWSCTVHCAEGATRLTGANTGLQVRYSVLLQAIPPNQGRVHPM